MECLQATGYWERHKLLLIIIINQLLELDTVVVESVAVESVAVETVAVEKVAVAVVVVV